MVKLFNYSSSIVEEIVEYLYSTFEFETTVIAEVFLVFRVLLYSENCRSGEKTPCDTINDYYINT